jgi:hypothetical protein
MKQLLLVLSLTALSLTGAAQPIAHYFTQMPAELIPGITIDTRKDLIDFCKNGKLSVMPAPFGGKVQLKTLEEDYLLLQTSERSDVQIKLLRVSDSLRVLAVVTTVAGPLSDSRVKFYTTSWKPLKDWSVPVFTVNDFVDVQKAASLGLTDRLNEIGPRLFVSVIFKPTSTTFVAKSSLKDDMEKAQSEKLGALVRDSVVYRLSNNRFLPE